MIGVGGRTPVVKTPRVIGLRKSDRKKVRFFDKGGSPVPLPPGHVTGNLRGARGKAPADRGTRKHPPARRVRGAEW